MISNSKQFKKEYPDGQHFNFLGSFSSIFFPALKSAVRSRTPLLTKVSSVATYFLVAAGRERQEG